jgi:hypothetical protein
MQQGEITQADLAAAARERFEALQEEQRAVQAMHAAHQTFTEARNKHTAAVTKLRHARERQEQMEQQLLSQAAPDA